VVRDDRGAVWFGFDYKSHPNCEINCMRLVWFGWFLKSHLNQTNAVRVGSVCAVYRNIKNMTILSTYDNITNLLQNKPRKI
jgi:hypothetical protein